jgi:hypothetical protein
MQRRHFLIALAAWRGLLPGPAAAVDFAPVLPGRRLVFPDDFGAHPDFRTEWWYATGWLKRQDGRPLGFQITFFRVRTGIGERNASRFAPRQLVLAHAAIADPNSVACGTANGRPAPASAMPATPSAAARCGSATGDSPSRKTRKASAIRPACAARILPTISPWMPPPAPAQRPAGLQQQGSRPAPRQFLLQPAATGGERLALPERPDRGGQRPCLARSRMVERTAARRRTGLGLGRHQPGRWRRADGLPPARRRGNTLWAAASCAPGKVDRIFARRVHFRPLRHWRSPRTGIDYPVAWRLRVGEREFELNPLLDDQELDSRRSVGTVYWEGAIRVSGERPACRRGLS